MKYFNTVGPINPQKHYFLPHRLNWEQLKDFIEKQYYFILHAPRQSGKTTAIKEFVRTLNQEGKYLALYVSTEMAHAAANDAVRAVELLLDELRDAILDTIGDKVDWINYLENLKVHATKERGVYEMLRFMAETSGKPLVIFFDEFDGLVGESLIVLLKQFRSGYSKRPDHFPQTICLIGVRDLRDYRTKNKTQEELGVLYSPFNIKAESLVLPNFSLKDVRTLYEQHTTETGQKFTDEAIEYAYELTQGQPWLVNALAYQACFRNVQDRNIMITKEIIDNAKNELIARRDTHLDALTDRLKEPRVLRIIDAVIAGTLIEEEYSTDDLQYVRDLGIVGPKGIEIANPIYKEILPRALTYARQEGLPLKTAWYLDKDGRLNMHKLFEDFQQFYRENSASWLKYSDYKEAGPHLIIMAYLQRVINGGGKILREYALGSKRVDLFVIWKDQRIVIELKMLHSGKTIDEGLVQTAEYMDINKATEGHLVIFDKDKEKPWEKKIFCEQKTVGNKVIDVWGC